MHSVKKSAWQLALMLGLVSPVWATDDLLTAKLIDEAHHWQEKNRYDLAANAWRKLLLAVPDHPEALSQLRAAGAQPLPNRDGSSLSKPVRPGNRPVDAANARSGFGESRAFQGSSSMMVAAPKKQPEVAVTVPATRVPIPAVQPALSGQDRKPVQSDVLAAKHDRAAPQMINDVHATSSQSRRSPSAIHNDWDQTRQSLEMDARRHPDSLPAMLALTRHLATHEATRRESLRQMADYARRGLVDPTMRQSWRTTLIALEPRPGNATFFARYLAYYPNDAEVRERVQSIATFSANDITADTATIAPTTKATALRLSPSLLQQSNSHVDEH
jgi:hypothetical protein